MQKHSEQDGQVQRIIIIEGLANLGVLLTKLIVGLSTGSIAIIGDAIHSLTDVVNNIVAWIVLRIAHRPADTKHPYGHRKFETLAVFGLASLLVVLAFELASQAIQRETTNVVTGDWEMGLMLGVLCVNISLATWQRKWAKRLNSNIIHADASHTFADVLTTLVVIVGWQLSAIGYAWLDQVCAVGVAALIFFLAFKLFQRVIPALVDESAIDPVRLAETTREIAGVEKVASVRSRWIGSDSAVDMTVLVDSRLTTLESHVIADAIEAALAREFDVRDVTIHIEPIETGS
jgi:cation diffusion facilitator family transporter